MPAVPASCQTAAAQIFAEEAGRIGYTASRIGLHSSPWTLLPKQDEWKSGMGEIISRFIPQRSQPLSPTAWTPVSISDGSSATGCRAEFETLSFASDLQTAKLYQKWIDSEWFCYMDLLQKWDAAQQIDAYAEVFAENIALTWADLYRDEYQKACDHKVIADTVLTEGSSAAFPNVAPTFNLDMGTLKRFRSRLIRDGAGNKANAFNSRNAPVFTLITSEEQVDSLVREDPETRQDFRYSGRVGELLGPLGAFDSWGGFNFMTDPFPRHYNFESGAYVEVPRYKNVAATRGTKAEINEAYEDAECMVSYIWPNEDVIHFLNPNPNLKFNGIEYNAQNFRGDVSFFNEKDLQCNPFGDQGKWIARLATAPSPVHTRWGYAIMHLRCHPVRLAAACGTYSGYGA